MYYANDYINRGKKNKMLVLAQLTHLNESSRSIVCHVFIFRLTHVFKDQFEFDFFFLVFDIITIFYQKRFLFGLYNEVSPFGAYSYVIQKYSVPTIFISYIRKISNMKTKIIIMKSNTNITNLV